MDCIFKEYGYNPPKYGLCECEPLRSSLISKGYDEIKATHFIERLRLVYTALEADDILRDETNPILRMYAKATRKICGFLLPIHLERIVKEIDLSVKSLERKPLAPSTYLNWASELAGRVFVTISMDPSLYELGASLGRVLVAHDMKRDLEKDMITKSYNPLRETPGDSKLTQKLLGYCEVKVADMVQSVKTSRHYRRLRSLFPGVIMFLLLIPMIIGPPTFCPACCEAAASSIHIECPCCSTPQEGGETMTACILSIS